MYGIRAKGSRGTRLECKCEFFGEDEMTSISQTSKKLSSQSKDIYQWLNPNISKPEIIIQEGCVFPHDDSQEADFCHSVTLVGGLTLEGYPYEYSIQEEDFKYVNDSMAKFEYFYQKLETEHDQRATLSKEERSLVK